MCGKSLEHQLNQNLWHTPWILHPFRFIPRKLKRKWKALVWYVVLLSRRFRSVREHSRTCRYTYRQRTISNHIGGIILGTKNQWNSLQWQSWGCRVVATFKTRFPSFGNSLLYVPWLKFTTSPITSPRRHAMCFHPSDKFSPTLFFESRNLLFRKLK